MPHPSFCIVEGYLPTEAATLDNLREQVWSFALDQRAFGPRKLWVAFAAGDGRFRGLAYTDRTDPPELGFQACLEYLGAGAAAAIAFCDQPVTDGPPPKEFVDLFERARLIAAEYRIQLVDWIACDDDTMRSNRTSIERDQLDDEWWDVLRSVRPDREASIADLARETATDPGNLHAEVERLVRAGILADRRAGRTRLLHAADSPLNRSLADLLLLGYGPKVAIEHALSDIPGIDHAYIGGSWAARYLGENGPFPHDIDVIVVGSPDRDDVAEAVVNALTAIGHDAQVIFRSPSAWRDARDAFTRTAKTGPLVELDLGRSRG